MRRVLTAILGMLSASAVFAGLDPGLASYQPKRALSGELTTTVNDEAVAEVVEAWAAAFMKDYPGLKVSVKERKALVPREGAKGSAGAPALGARALHFGPGGWVLSAAERKQFATEHGYAPLEMRVGLGTSAEKGKPHALAVFVNAQNPLQRLTLAEVDAIFSRTRQGGYPRDIATWGDVGLTGEWAQQPIHLYGKKRSNVITAFFQERVLKGGAFKESYAEQENSDAAVAAVVKDKLGIAFSGLGFATEGVKALALAEQEGGPYAPAVQASVEGWSYPLNRYLYAVVDKAPEKPLDPAVEEFLRFILSREGQEALVKAGLLPLSAKIAGQELGRVR
jgi:phosphate transport system substrate-binding protein